MVARGDAPKDIDETIWTVTLNSLRTGGARTACASDGLTMTLELTRILPKAIHSNDFTKEDLEQWQIFLSGFTRHEARHDSVIVAETSAFLDRVTAERHVSVVTKSVARCVDELTAQIRRASDALDTVTEHGRTDGAVLIIREQMA